LRWFLLAMILANIAGQMLYSLLSLYIVHLGATVTQMGLVFTLASLVPMALQIFGGWLSDTIGRLRSIAIASSIAVFGYLIIAFAPSWEWVLLGLSVEYVSNAVVGPSFGAYVSEQSSEESRGRVFGLISGLYLSVTVIGPALAGWLAYRINFPFMLRTAFVIYACATLLRLWMAGREHFEKRKSDGVPTLAGFKSQMAAMFTLLVGGGILTWIWVTDAVGDTTFNLIGDLYPVYLASIGKMNLEQIGLLNAIRGLGMIAGSFAAGWLVDKTSERFSIVCGFLLQAIGLALLIHVRSFAAFTATMVVFGMGMGSMMPAYEALISKVVPEDKRGLAFGLFGTSLGILSLPMPWIGAQLWAHFSPQTPFWFTVAACLVSIPIAWSRFAVKKVIQIEG
jgi:MFS family permease